MRFSLKRILILELALVLLFLNLAMMIPGWRDLLGYISAFWSVALVLHVLIVPFKGLGYVIWDADRVDATSADCKF